MSYDHRTQNCTLLYYNDDYILADLENLEKKTLVK